MTPKLNRHVDTSRLMTVGLVTGAAGLLLLAVVSPNGLALTVTAMSITAFGIAIPMALVLNIILSAAPPERAGSAASLSETSGEFGVALGVAMLGTLSMIVYRSSLDLQLPDGTSSEVEQAAKESIAAAVHLASSSSPGAVSVLEASRAAFTTGLNVLGVVAGAALIILAALTATGLTPSNPRIGESK